MSNRPSVWVPFQFAAPVRGQRVRTEGGGEGWYVGTTRGGTPWVCYRPERFQTMCERFDSREAR